MTAQVIEVGSWVRVARPPRDTHPELVGMVGHVRLANETMCAVTLFKDDGLLYGSASLTNDCLEPHVPSQEHLLSKHALDHMMALGALFNAITDIPKGDAPAY